MKLRRREPWWSWLWLSLANWSMTLQVENLLLIGPVARKGACSECSWDSQSNEDHSEKGWASHSGYGDFMMYARTSDEWDGLAVMVAAWLVSWCCLFVKWLSISDTVKLLKWGRYSATLFFQVPKENRRGCSTPPKMLAARWWVKPWASVLSYNCFLVNHF